MLRILVNTQSWTLKHPLLRIDWYHIDISIPSESEVELR
jgi:hypothetical protein